MHEGASGGGKSEMTEHIHRMEDGRLLLGENVVTHEQRTLNLPQGLPPAPHRRRHGLRASQLPGRKQAPRRRRR
jgi:hypothetical protein